MMIHFKKLPLSWRVSELENSDNHVDYHEKMGLFVDPRETALSISLDGAQLTIKKTI